MIRIACALIALTLAACAGGGYRDTGVPMTSMAVFDPARYAGIWYEVASFPAPFQAGCANTMAEYIPAGASLLTVRNTCLKDGNATVIEGTAWIDGPGRLKVRLDGVPVAADYWVLWVDEAYRTAVVGVPSGRAGWILNRDPRIPPDRLKAARDVLEFSGYDLGELRMTPQSGA